MSGRVADWSGLAVELLEMIAGNVDEIADRVRFGAVCKPWRSVSRSPRLPPVCLPWLLIDNRDQFRRPSRARLEEEDDPFLESFDVSFDNGDDGVQSFLNFSNEEGDDIQSFLNFSDEEDFFQSLLMSTSHNRKREDDRKEDGGVRSFVSIANDKIYALRIPNTCGRECFGSAHGWLLLADQESCSKGMLLMMMNPLTGAWLSLPRIQQLTDPVDCCRLIKSPEGLVVMVVNSSRDMIFSCQLDEGADGTAATWENLQFRRAHRGGVCSGIGDFAYHRGYYLIIGEKLTGTLVIDANTREAVVVIPLHVCGFRYKGVPFHKRYLVKSFNGDDLFLVMSRPRSTKDLFDVFKLDHTEQNPARWNWFKVRSIGHDLLFVDDKSAMALPARGFDGVRQNCIVFYDHDPKPHAVTSGSMKDHQFSLFDIRSGGVERLAVSCHEKIQGWAKHAWFLPSI